MATKSSPIFVNRLALDFRYVPSTLIERQAAYDFLRSCFTGLLAEGVSSTAAIWGPVGSGKTAVTRRFASDLEAAAKQAGKRIEVVYLNCRHLESASAALAAVMIRLGLRNDRRGWSAWECVQDLRRALTIRKLHLLLIFDEVEILQQRDGSELTYALSRFMEDQTVTDCSISAILLGERNPFNFMDDATRSTFRASRVLALDMYKPEAMRQILAVRANEALLATAYDDELLQAATEQAVRAGDVRVGLDVLQRAAELAEAMGSPCILSNHVETAARNHAEGWTTLDWQGLPEHQRLTVQAVLDNTVREPETTTGKAEETYTRLCQASGLRPHAHTQFWKDLKRLCVMGFLESRKSGKGQAGTTQLLSAPDGIRRVAGKLYGPGRASA